MQRDKQRESKEVNLGYDDRPLGNEEEVKAKRNIFLVVSATMEQRWKDHATTIEVNLPPLATLLEPQDFDSSLEAEESTIVTDFEFSHTQAKLPLSDPCPCTSVAGTVVVDMQATIVVVPQYHTRSDVNEEHEEGRAELKLCHLSSFFDLMGLAQVCGEKHWNSEMTQPIKTTTTDHRPWSNLQTETEGSVSTTPNVIQPLFSACKTEQQPSWNPTRISPPPELPNVVHYEEVDPKRKCSNQMEKLTGDQLPNWWGKNMLCSIKLVHNFLNFKCSDTHKVDGPDVSSKCMHVRLNSGGPNNSGRSSKIRKERGDKPFDSRDSENWSENVDKFLSSHLSKENKDTQEALGDFNNGAELPTIFLEGFTINITKFGSAFILNGIPVSCPMNSELPSIFP